jgi:hypothetical protein
MIETTHLLNLVWGLVEFIILMFIFEFINISLKTKKIRMFGTARKLINNFLFTLKATVENILLNKRPQKSPVQVINIFLVIFSSTLLFIFSTQFENINISISALIILISINAFGIMTALRNEKVHLDSDAKTLVNMWFLVLVIVLMVSSELFILRNQILNTVVCAVTMILIFKIIFMWISSEINKTKEWHNQVVGNIFLLSSFVAIANYFILKTNFTFLDSVKLEVYVLAVGAYLVMKLSLVQNSVNRIEYMLQNVLYRFVNYTLIITTVRLLIWKF